MNVPNRTVRVSLVTVSPAMLDSLRLPKSERIALVGAAVVSIVLRAVAFFHYRFDSDEPQHLHVVWGWTRGLVQYRDVFDNHTPLFHLTFAPLLARLGERPDILLYMRAPMLVFWAIVLICTWILGARLYDRHIAAAATVMLSLFPTFFLKSLEFRNDNPWSALWMLSVVVLTGGPIAPLRLFIAGVILGTSAAISLKTIILVVTLLICAIATRALCGGDVSLRRWIAAIAAGLAGIFVVPLIVIAVFVRLGAWPSMRYCLIDFNDAAVRVARHVAVNRAIYPLILGAILYAAYRLTRGRTFDVVVRRRFFFGLFFFVFTASVACFWVMISPRDFVPVMPIGAVLGIPALQRIRMRHVSFTGAFTVVAFAFIGFTTYYADSFENKTDEHITMMRQVLGLTRPGEPLIDYKGETIYRRRPFYYILEQITREQFERAWIPDTIERDVVAAHCHVAQADGNFWPADGRRFLQQNFLDMGRLRVSGQWLHQDGGFTIAVPGEYVVVEYDGEAHGELDGSPYKGARYLQPGPHRFVHSVGPRRLAAMWAPAWNRGYSPFDLKDRDF